MILKISPSGQRKLFSKTSQSKGKSYRLLLLVLPIVLWFGYKQVEKSFIKPQALLVLGGSTKDLEREKFAAKLARENPDLPIWVSSGSTNKTYVKRVFAKAGVDPSRLRLDYKALDTVTNFTTLVDEMEAKGISSIYLITSDYHMRRARVIGEIVLGSRGIAIKPVVVETGNPSEPIEKSIRDGARAILWVTTGYTGATLSKSYRTPP
ncbi:MULTISPECIES: YdcF family protein [Cyanophyceae]|jgi:uncharacterized SAM-binding protein YcdF (DUF218 family)|uniref:YdcF family protein n=1 Tax=Cyanophyceae TaxID=3028117 RepID=UPI0016844BBF|nr:YdcF family protein [Trichocoleus sp. FACHB-40]MBD2006513.1 YdcF family protein [Trichocoleus sp. FACHB-40]